MNRIEVTSGRDGEPTGRETPLLTFNDLLRRGGVDPKDVRLARHGAPPGVKYRSLYAAWQDATAAGRQVVEEYQRIQRRDVFRVGGYVASFVVSPPPTTETVFIGLYAVKSVARCPPGMIDPYNGNDVGGRHLYDLEHVERFGLYEDRLVIDWGRGTRSWVQRADKQEKPIESFRERARPPFPGPAAFAIPIDEVLGVPDGWREYLQATKGVYVLVDMEDGKQYVGSAKGEESLWQRFAGYAADGHGGNVEMKRRMEELGPRAYQASIVQVVDTGMPDEGIEKLEGHWKRKLMSERFGLNRN